MLPPSPPVIAIIGAGLSGTLLAVNLVRYQGCHVKLIERSTAKVARGVAYSTENPRHLLNVRASNMSAFPDDRDHFLHWLDQLSPDGQNRFVERRTFGAYIQQLLDAARAEHPERLTLITGEATDAERRGDGWAVSIAGHGVLDCDRVVLAQGNFPPADLPAFASLAPPLYFSDPWSPDAVAKLGDHDQVLLVGTGLTAVDVALSLDSAGFRGTIHALSRRGLRPRAHATVGPHAGPIDQPREQGSWLVRRLRTRAAEMGWRTAIDELRPHIQDIWRTMDQRQREAFLRHLRPFWDVHRHRLAPAVDRRITALQMEGRLRFLAGKIESVEDFGDGGTVQWRVRGTDARRTLTVQRIINCTGPLGDIDKCADSLVNGLRAQGLVRADPLGLGLDVCPQGKLRSGDGQIQGDLLAIGPMTRGECWEITAVPDIRQQAWAMARHLTHSQWVEGEGL